LALSSPVPSSYLRAAKSLGWMRASVLSRPVSSGELSDARSLPPRPSEELSLNPREPAPPKPPECSAWPSSLLWPSQNRRRGLEPENVLSAAGVPADAVPSNSVDSNQIQSSLGFK